jgi:tRNA(adenine34) deaminase
MDGRLRLCLNTHYMNQNHEQHMALALQVAQQAMDRGDWPTGSVIVRGERVLATGQNRQNSMNDITVHAETDALRNAFKTEKTTDLSGATLYTTMEPCPMCAEAMRMAKVGTLVLGLRHADLNRIDLGTYSIEAYTRMLNWPLEIVNGVRHAECAALRRRWGKDKTAPA